MPLLNLQAMALRVFKIEQIKTAERLLLDLRCSTEAQFLLCRWSPVHPDLSLGTSEMIKVGVELGCHFLLQIYIFV